MENDEGGGRGEMKERQRWRSEEDAILRAYVRQWGPREWHLVAHRMNAPFLRRDAKSCLERWKNYLRPGIKKGSLTEEEQRLVVRLQAKHGNKWKRIASELPGRTPKRLGKWWEVFKDKQTRHSDTTAASRPPIETANYDAILESFAEKLVGEAPAVVMLPPWHLNPNSAPAPPPCVDLTLGGAVIGPTVGDCCRDLREGYEIWAANRKEAAWRVKRVELQMEAEKARKRREKTEEIEARIRALREEERAELERIEIDYRDRVLGMRREAEAREQRLAEQWAAKHLKLSKLAEQLVVPSVGPTTAGR